MTPESKITVKTFLPFFNFVINTFKNTTFNEKTFFLLKNQDGKNFNMADLLEK
jgi:hypothetical protein